MENGSASVENQRLFRRMGEVIDDRPAVAVSKFGYGFSSQESQNFLPGLFALDLSYHNKSLEILPLVFAFLGALIFLVPLVLL